jgi:DNA-binding MarR family transcriptional regulator
MIRLNPEPDGQRQLATRRLAHIMQMARGTYEAARMELIEALSQQQMAAYALVGRQGTAKAADVVDAMGISIGHASGILKGLVELHLLEREMVIDEVGKKFVYRVK